MDRCLYSFVGCASSMLPNNLSALVDQAVNESVSQHLNDSIRQMRADERSECDEDVKETFKFHRDIATYQQENVNGGGGAYSCKEILRQSLYTSFNLPRYL